MDISNRNNERLFILRGAGGGGGGGGVTGGVASLRTCDWVNVPSFPSPPPPI